MNSILNQQELNQPRKLTKMRTHMKLVIFFMLCSVTFLFMSYDCEMIWSLRNAVNNFSGFDPYKRRVNPNVNITEVYEQLDLRRQTRICSRLFRGNMAAQQLAMSSNYTTHVPIPEEAYVLMSHDCVRYRKERGYVMSSSAAELTFPLAFSILFYKEVELAERLLRAIYRPQNVYCLHVDRKATVDIHEAAASIASCFDNVFLVPSPVSVQWGTASVIEAEIGCMHLLWNYKQVTKWKYFINLTGQEYPLKTNAELVKILRTYDGANDIAFQVGEYNKFKKRTSFRCEDGRPTEKLYQDPPFDMRIAVGSTHMAVSRAFVDFVLHNPVAHKLFDWVKNTCIPDETYFNMMYINPQLGVPGAYTGPLSISDVINVHFTRFKIWRTKAHECKGREVRLVCIQNIYYLPELKHAREMFVNKFHLGYQPLALRCLEELMYERTLQDVRHHQRHLDLDVYTTSHFVRNSLRQNVKFTQHGPLRGSTQSPKQGH